MSAKWTFWAWGLDINTAPKKLAVLQLANNSNDDGKSWYSISKMAAACGVSERTFQRQIQSLEESGFLHVERRSNRPSIYTLNDEVEITLHKDAGCQSVTLGCQSVTLGCQSVTSRGVRESPDLNSDPNSLPNNKDLCVIDSDIDDFAFDYFWSNWHNKKGKVKAEQAFEKVFKKRCKELKIEPTVESKIKFAETLSADTKKRIATQQMGFDKIHPTTYLNGERWSDDYDTSGAKVANGVSQPLAKLSPSERFRQKMIAAGKRPSF